MGRPPLSSIQVATTDRVLDAAELAFAEQGLERARLEDVAARAGITRASLLYHFGSKERLHAAVVDRALGSLAAMLESAMAAPGAFDERVGALIEAFYTFVDVHPSLARIVLREVLAHNARVAEQARPVLDHVVAFLESEHPRRDIARQARGRLMLVISDVFLRVCSGDLERHFWGDAVLSRDVARRVLIGDESR